MKVAIYSRVSKESSDNMNQLIQLRDYCQKMGYDIYQEYGDVVSGAKEHKPKFEVMMMEAAKRRFDLLLFFSLDRLTREGMRKTIFYLQQLEDYGILYKSFSEQYLDSSGIFKDVIIGLLSTLAKQERIRISERVMAGLKRARQNGRIGGRPTLNENQIKKLRKMRTAGVNIVSISKELKISRGTIYNYLKTEKSEGKFLPTRGEE